MVRTLILGTAGHVDHGKTALVQALTGIDTDRLEEEHRRGISIELGFAHLELGDDLRLGVVDVPGHERFVRQMVAGAGGMDLAMLLVAADEGVMPQTREHLDVLELLGVPAGLVVITKIDLVERELQDVVAAEVEDLVEGSFLEGSPLLRVSARTGEGLDALRAALADLARGAPEKRRRGDFRLPVDRVFAMPGAGVVVTGTAWAGRVTVGQALRLLPSGVAVRVREVQSHGRHVEEAGAGERVALALHGVKKEDVARGDQLVAGGAWTPSSVLGVRVAAIAGPGGPFRLGQRARFHVHHAACEVLGRLDLLETNALDAGESGLARLLLESPLVARPGDRLVLRSYSPMVTVAGGIVLEPHPPARQRRADARAWLQRLEEAGIERWPVLRALASGPRGMVKREVLDAYGMLGRDLDEAARDLEAAVADGLLVDVGERVFAAEVLDRAVADALAKLRAHQEQAPLTPGLAKEELRQALGLRTSPQAFSHLLAHWTRRHPLFVLDDRVRADSAAPELTADQSEGLQRLKHAVAAAAPIYQATDVELRSPEMSLLASAGEVVKLGGRLVIARDRLDDIIAKAAEHFAHSEVLEVADVKAWTHASRKYVVPLLEWLDGHEITRFEASGRRKGPACPDA
jgi:selenocysteine-specific elongation factor